MCSLHWGCGRNKLAPVVLYVILFNNRIHNSAELLELNVQEGVNTYADSVLIWGEDKKENEKLNQWNHLIIKEYRLKKNTDKCVTMRIPKKPHINFKIKVNGTIVNQVNKLIIWKKKQIQNSSIFYEIYYRYGNYGWEIFQNNAKQFIFHCLSCQWLYLQFSLFFR